ncbi:hypothetical protein AVEN_262570-1 [Araneus ventricosus]|uniref:Uncharacterized protein n=1 Tax=Araneus ventricosus TaxID=182803 RepID=A0A4Y2GY23_ARAVE|nr:hypothetical protein AVEN_262570-1 [Araneus ventricosus]
MCHRLPLLKSEVLYISSFEKFYNYEQKSSLVCFTMLPSSKSAVASSVMKPILYQGHEGRGGLVVRSRPWVRNPIPLIIRRAWGLFHAKSYVVAKRPPVGVARKFGEEVPAQTSSSPSDRGSKLRGPSQDSPRVASKRDVNITKLNLPRSLTSSCSGLLSRSLPGLRHPPDYWR